MELKSTELKSTELKSTELKSTELKSTELKPRAGWRSPLAQAGRGMKREGAGESFGC